MIISVELGHKVELRYKVLINDDAVIVNLNGENPKACFLVSHKL